MARVILHEYCDEARERIKSRAYDDAIAICRQILQRYPKHIDAYRILGEASLEKGELEEATDAFKRLLSADPENFVAHAGLGVIHEEKQQLPEAVWHMERAFELASGNDDIRNALRRLYGKRDGTEPTRIKLNKVALARLYARGGQYRQAIEEFQRWLEVEPDRMDIKVSLAETLWRDGRREQAAETAREILRSAPYCLKAILLLGKIQLEKSRDEEGRATLVQAHAMDPENRVAQALFGRHSPMPAEIVKIPRLERMVEVQAAAIEASEPLVAPAAEHEPEVVTAPLEEGTPEKESEAQTSEPVAAAPAGERVVAVAGPVPEITLGQEPEAQPVAGQPSEAVAAPPAGGQIEAPPTPLQETIVEQPPEVQAEAAEVLEPVAVPPGEERAEVETSLVQEAGSERQPGAQAAPAQVSTATVAPPTEVWFEAAPAARQEPVPEPQPEVQAAPPGVAGPAAVPSEAGQVEATPAPVQEAISESQPEAQAAPAGVSEAVAIPPTEKRLEARPTPPQEAVLEQQPEVPAASAEVSEPVAVPFMEETVEAATSPVQEPIPEQQPEAPATPAEVAQSGLAPSLEEQVGAGSISWQEAAPQPKLEAQPAPVEAPGRVAIPPAGAQLGEPMGPVQELISEQEPASRPAAAGQLLPVAPAAVEAAQPLIGPETGMGLEETLRAAALSHRLPTSVDAVSTEGKVEALPPAERELPVECATLASGEPLSSAPTLDVERYKLQLQQNPKDEETRLALARVYCSQEQIELALEQYSMLARAKPKNLSEVISDMEGIVASRPGNLTAHELLADLYSKNGQLGNALDRYRWLLRQLEQRPTA